LELGGNAAAIIEPDADLAWAAARCAIGGYTYAGQSCISTQRIFVHQDVYRAFLDLLILRVERLKVGDVLDDQTEVGPLISLDAAERVERWITEAVSAGAELATGGKRSGQFLEPAVLLHTTPEMKVNCEEVFAPLVTVTSYQRLEDAIVRIHAHTICPATPHRTAESRCDAPTPAIAPVIVCVVLTGIPKCDATNSVIAPLVSAQNPPNGFSFVMRWPIVRTMRQPPAMVPRAIAAWALRITHQGITSAVVRWSARMRSEEHTSELQSRENLVCRLLLEKKKQKIKT